MMRRPDPRRRLALLVASVLTACGGTDAASNRCGEVSEPIFGGTTDGGSLDLVATMRAALVSIDTTGGTSLCTGTIVAPGRVLTAAHCKMEDVLVVRAPFSGQAAQSRHMTVHPALDAMVVELASEVGFTAALPPSPADVDAGWIGKEAQMAGFGRTEDGRRGELRYVKEPVVDVRPDEIWVDGNGASGACDGDSGGPLVGLDDQGRPGVLGILSRGSQSCLGVDVYVAMRSLRPWLEQVMKASSGCLDTVSH
jgi:hypothetical protein